MKKEIALFFVLLCGYVFWQFYISRFQYGESSILGQTAPEFQTSNVRNGEVLNSQDLFGKKFVFVNFWATWCDTCRLEIGNLNTLYKSLDPNQVEFVSFLEDSVQNREELKVILEKYNQKLPVEFPAYWDAQQVTADAYGTFKIPESYVIDLQGKVIYRHEGAIMERDLPKILEKITKSAQ